MDCEMDESRPVWGCGHLATVNSRVRWLRVSQRQNPVLFEKESTGPILIIETDMKLLLFSWDADRWWAFSQLLIGCHNWSTLF